MHIRIALLGFGNVNREFARLLLRKTDALKDEHDLTFTVTGIASRVNGASLALKNGYTANAFFGSPASSSGIADSFQVSNLGCQPASAATSLIGDLLG